MPEKVMRDFPGAALSVLVIALALVGCSNSVVVADKSLGQVTINGDRAGHHDPLKVAALAQPEGAMQADLDAETAVSPGCLEAWRKCLKGDEKGCMSQLKELDSKYPDIGTVKFMMGQCLEHLGKKKEAIFYYRQSVERSEFNTFQKYRLAEALRTTGDAKGAVEQYRQLLKESPQSVPAHLGLARALVDIDKHSPEARKIVGDVLAADPDDKEAKAILDRMESAK